MEEAPAILGKHKLGTFLFINRIPGTYQMLWNANCLLKKPLCNESKQGIRSTGIANAPR